MLKKIKEEDLMFSGNIEDDRVNTYLSLDDYDWMNYCLQTAFRTNEQGKMNVKFEYFGLVTSTMEVTQELNGTINKYEYEYPTDIFEMYIKKFLFEHIKSWSTKYSFYGGDIVLKFYNEVIEKGTLKLPS